MIVNEILFYDCNTMQDKVRMVMKKNKFIKIFTTVLACTILAYFIFKYKIHLGHFNIRGLRRYILSYGKFSAIAFVLIYSLKPIFLVIPASLLSILAGSIFGPYEAFTLSMISCYFAGTLGFFLSKFLGKSFVHKLLKGKAVALDSNAEEHGFKIMLIMRLSTLFPYDPLSYAAGLTKMKYRDFILASLLGIAPEMLAYSFMGKNLRHPLSLKFALPIIIVAIVAVISSYVYKSVKDKD